MTKTSKLRCVLVFFLFVILSVCFGGQTASAGYVLGPEDVVTLTVMRHPEFSGDLLVPSSGVINVPAIGDVSVTGSTIEAVREKIQTLFKKRMRKPEVYLALKSAGPKRVYVVGDVRESGVYDYKPGWGLAEALSAAGGLKDGIQSVDVTVFVQHPDGTQFGPVRLAEALDGGKGASVVISPGDVIKLNDIRLITVNVSGLVKNPGSYHLRTDNTSPMTAIADAGGVTDGATYVVQIVHPSGSQETVDLAPALVHGAHVDMPALQDGDTIVVPQQNKHFVVLGYVGHPGAYPILDGHTYNLSDAIAAAEGESSKRPRLTRVGLVRVTNGKKSSKVYDLTAYVRKGDTRQNPPIESGDLVYVPEASQNNLTAILGAMSAAAVIYYYTK